jgi:hypothetical protein
MPLLGPDGRPLDAAPAEELLEATPDSADEEAAPPPPLPCVTAFIVYQLPTGQWQVADDIDVPLVPERKAHFDDMTAGCSVTLRDVATQEAAMAAANLIIPNTVQGTVQGVIQAQMEVGKKVMEAREAADIAKKLEADKHRRGGR